MAANGNNLPVGERGEVVALNYREDEWPEGQVAPYQIMLQTGALIFAPLDEDRVVRKAA